VRVDVAAMSSYVSAGLRRIVVDRADGLCEYCLIHEQDTFLGCQVEHIISEKHGGGTIDANLALACVFCNRFKGSDVATVSPGTGRLTRLFNPRTDRRAEHSRLDGVRVVGLSEIGEATAPTP
jgi:5-methylcytosine-specific restriction endonuclease McrA